MRETDVKYIKLAPIKGPLPASPAGAPPVMFSCHTFRKNLYLCRDDVASMSYLCRIYVVYLVYFSETQ